MNIIKISPSTYSVTKYFDCTLTEVKGLYQHGDNQGLINPTVISKSPINDSLFFSDTDGKLEYICGDYTTFRKMSRELLDKKGLFDYQIDFAFSIFDSQQVAF